MDASALLTRHGWRGKGHSLDPHNRGIAKPLLVSSKRDLSGVGARSKAVRTSDQWWARALDEGLRELGTGKVTTLQTVREKGVSQGGLYGFFVRGEGLEGTMSNSEVTTTTSTPPTSASDVGDDASEDENGDETATREEAIVVVETNKKRKRSPGETKEEGAKRRKGERRDTQNNGQLQTTLEQIAKINRRATALIKQQSKRGRFDVGTLDPSLPQEKEEDAGCGIHSDRMKMLNGGVKLQIQVTPQEPTKPEKNLSNKKAKIVDEKAIREAKRELKFRLIREAQGRGELPGMEHLTPEKVLKRHKEESKAAKKVQKEEKRILKSNKKKAKKEYQNIEKERGMSNLTAKAKPLADEQRKD
ncbi:uncharacterized protein BDZ99DRAFT_243363 [Mytilinidion resinicola]|uniref:G-patch domain-containing protein n=1 Tax=Mytilinidion resinicola TaxID=574789 RepID=A0A6A6YVN7_9PEZI|nr:uncharacterized protein BDZ99DRAFT_243363 [Mytilinidion resinicola]KAF2812830.1 hypothetical protein BDZ99DRAFT_243363 [Mytilinidion resinicola]